MKQASIILSLTLLLFSCSNVQESEGVEQSETSVQSSGGSEKIKSETKEAYNFQSDPKAVVEEVFSAAETKDFSKLSLLLDPEGESDEPCKHICAVASASKRRQDEFVEYFKKGKVISEPVIDGITAIVEITFGLDGTHEETIYLVQRKGLWYLGSI